MLLGSPPFRNHPIVPLNRQDKAQGSLEYTIVTVSLSAHREILQPSTYPGECWCFHGSEGQAIVRLAVPVHVTGVSLEHIPKSLAHTGRIDSAPRDFLIKALESDSAQDGEILGSFTYNEDGKPIQYFPVMARSDGKPTLFVELVITSNHGHPEYTCVYRLRVHGHMATEADAK
ncbi:SUN domain-containing protein 1 [Taenia solium]|eukprot:TsM_000945900 transcript=TsM_000945900 gene=TsM_000945900